jgi:hypothetical protein
MFAASAAVSPRRRCDRFPYSILQEPPMRSIHRPHSSHLLVFVSLATLSLASCSSGPARVNQPYIDADGAGELAMEQYDTNSDGIVAGDELEKAPGLKAALATMDTNRDKGVSAEEVTARINVWKQMRTGVFSFPFTVTLDGRPLEEAMVTFVPESFLGDEIKPASSQTNFGGGGGATIAKVDRPSPTSPPGMHLGLYQVKISKQVNGREMVPPKYNEATTLGQEVAADVPEILNNHVVYTLSTK